MLFSQKTVADYMSANFECAWQELRPVPQVFIDFGNGRTLRRTLEGNVATWITDAKGRALDVVPALYTPVTYRKRLADALQMARRLAGLDGDARRSELAAYHRKHAASAAGRTMLALLSSTSKPRDFLSKGVVERPMKVAIGKKFRTKRSTSVNPRLARSALAKQMVETPPKTALKRSLKSVVERPVKSSLGSLAKDENYNLTVRAPKAHLMLASAPDARVSELTERFFRTVLNVKLKDPYLGLAPYVLGGERGRR